MKIAKNLSIFLSIIAALALLSGCSTTTQYDNPYAEVYDRADKRSHFLGLVEIEEDSYEPVSRTSITVKSDDIVDRRNISGEKTSLFWNLLTFTDY